MENTLSNLTVNDAIKICKEKCPDESAKIYAGAAMKASLTYGKEGLHTQILYILANTRYWRGEEARACKKVMKDWSKKYLKENPL